MKTCLRVLLPLALLAVLGLPAAAQTELTGINWEVSKLEGKNRAPFTSVTALRASPELKFTDRLRAIVALRNASAAPVEGLVLRYAVRLRLIKKGDAPEKAFWGAPCYFEEVRVTKINPASERQVKLLRFDLAEQLRRLRNTGFYPTAIKLEVMIGPRLGDSPESITRESALEIAKI